MYFHQIFIADKGSVATLPYRDNIQTYFPQYEYKLWTHEELRSMIIEKFDSEVLNVFDGFVPYAYKADLAKYCLLYAFGGWYSDINNMMINTLEVRDDVDAVIFSDIFSASGSTWAVTPSLTYGKKGYPVFEKAIDIVINNYNKKYYGRTPLCPTGPVPYGEAFVREGLNINQRYLIGKLIDSPDGRFFTMDDGRQIARYKPNGLPGGNMGIEGTNNYNQFWYDRKVYGE